MKEFPKNYDHTSIDQKWQKFWQDNLTYKWNEEEPRENNFVIDTPPPTVSGTLHMGHVFSYTQADFIARFKRMKGMNVFYPIGFDDNGLPTERLVEKVKNIRAHQLPREEFIKTCQEVVASAEEDFRALFNSIALSVDWSQEYQTISSTSRTISQMSFIDLYNKGKAYRKLQPCLWDSIDKTALAQADVVDKEQISHMNHIKFGLENTSDYIVIATTRPELLPACVSIFCHPDDARYKHLIGQNAITPLFHVKVPIIADSDVDMEKGSGLVMCCTFGDIMDINWWRKHNLPLRTILNEYAKVVKPDNFGKENWESLNLADAIENFAKLENLKVKDAREKIIELLKEKELLLVQEEITQVVKCAERSGAHLEMLVTPQWFIKILDYKKEFLAKTNECEWHPPYMKLRLENWIEGLNWDWCISRQRYFGVPFPVWYSKRKGEEGKILIADVSQLPVDPLVDLPIGYTREEVEADMDVMDTWATSSVSPQLSSLSITEKLGLDLERHKKLFPADLRPQAHEIIRTWAFYTLVKSYMHEESIPWKNLMISGWCLAADKTKMSKSKGNVVTPVDLILAQGCDVVRYWASNSKLGADIAYSEEIFKIGKKLINKLWNASKFASMHLSKLQGEITTPLRDIEQGLICEDIDLWLLSRLKNLIEIVTKEFERFEYSSARNAIEDFFWNDFCDNYLEIIKTRSYNNEGKNDKGQQSAIRTTYHALKHLLLLLAPFLPHVTEELNNIIFSAASLHERNSWPSSANFVAQDLKLEEGKAMLNIIAFVRRIKADKQLSANAPLNTIYVRSNKLQASLIKNSLDDLKSVTGAANILLEEGSDVTLSDEELFKIGVEI